MSEVSEYLRYAPQLRKCDENYSQICRQEEIDMDKYILDRAWSKCKQMTLPITVKMAQAIDKLVEQCIYYVGSLTVIIFDMNAYVWQTQPVVHFIYAFVTDEGVDRGAEHSPLPSPLTPTSLPLFPHFPPPFPPLLSPLNTTSLPQANYSLP